MTRYAIISDIHANLIALDAILYDISRLKEPVHRENIWALGDLVVYGVYPVETFQRLKEYGILIRCVSGNNDFAIAHSLDADSTNIHFLSGPMRAGSAQDSTIRLRRMATMAVHNWTKQAIAKENENPISPHLGDEIFRTLEDLPRFAWLPEQNVRVMLVHASPCEYLGMNGNYLREVDDAEEAFEILDSPVCFFGHTHLPTVFLQDGSGMEEGRVKRISPRAGDTIQLDPRHKALINPGSAGQPRDGDNRASYAIYDTAGTVEFHRVSYDIQAVKTKIIEISDQLKSNVAEQNRDLAPQITQSLISRFIDADW